MSSEYNIEKKMRAMVLKRVCDLREERRPLELAYMDVPSIKENEILVRVSACGVCHTELDEIEGRTPPRRFPMVLGHQIVGTVVECGKAAKRFRIGDRVGIGWINSSCGQCVFCKDGRENLCEQFMATGRDVEGGYAEYTKVDENYAFSIPEGFSDPEAAPLLCAGAIGYRALRLTSMKNGDTLGLIGFGASAHIVIQLAKHLFPSSKILVFARSEGERDFAMELGAFWAGDIEDSPPIRPEVAIDTTPAWRPVLYGLSFLQRGGRLVINAIRKESADKDEMKSIDYERQLWLEKEVKTVANVTRRDIEEFLEIAVRIPIRPEVKEFSLEEANEALLELKERKIRGAKVLRP